MTDPATPTTLETTADPQQDIIGRLASALDSISDVSSGLLEFLKTQAMATDQALKQAKAATQRAGAAGGLPSAAEVRAATAGLPPEDRAEIEAAVTAKDPAKALRLLKEKVQGEGVRPNPGLDKDQADAQKQLASCTLFVNGKAERTTAQQVLSVVQFVESLLAWLDSVVDMLPMGAPDKSLDGFGRAVRSMGFIKNHLLAIHADNPTASDPTRRMLHEIFDSFGMTEGHTSIIDIVSYAASTMPELADAVMALTGHEYAESTSGLGRWQTARRVIKDGRSEDQALGHLFNKLVATPEFREHTMRAVTAAFSEPQEGSKAAREFLEYMGGYDGPLEQGWSAIVLTLLECVEQLEKDHAALEARSPAD